MIHIPGNFFVSSARQTKTTISGIRRNIVIKSEIQQLGRPFRPKNTQIGLRPRGGCSCCHQRGLQSRVGKPSLQGSPLGVGIGPKRGHRVI